MAPVNFLCDFFKIYSYGECRDKVVMCLGIILALGSGVVVPLFMYFWGKSLDHLMADINNLSNTMDKSTTYFLSFIGLAVGTFVINGVVFAIWKMLSERIAYQFRIKYMQSFVKRSIGWLERQNLY
jgi:ABC-type multidrug transport system fused ATPase/permease subunit